MSSDAILIILLAGAVHAAWNLISKRAGVGSDFVLLYAPFSCLLYAPVAIWLWPSFKSPGSLFAWSLIALSGLLHIAYAMLLQEGYEKADLSVVYPIARGTGPLLSSLGAAILFHESITLSLILGVASIIAGIFMLAMPIHFENKSGVAYGAATGLCIACYTLVDATTMRKVAMAPLLLDFLANTLRCIFLLPIYLRRRATLGDLAHKAWKPALAVAFLSPISYALVLYAMAHSPVSRVAPLREVSMLFAVLAGSFILSEKQGPRRFFGAGLIALGVVALSQ